MKNYDTQEPSDESINQTADAFVGIVRTGLSNYLDWDPVARPVPPEFRPGPAVGHPAFTNIEFKPSPRETA